MNFKKLIIYSSVFSIQGLSNAAIPVLPELAGKGSGNSIASNLLFSGYFVGALLALVPFGILADRIGNLKVIVFGVLLTALSGLVILFSDSLWVLGISRFLEGIGCGAFFPAAFSMIAKWKDSQRSLGEFNFLLNAGLAAGVFLSGMLAELGIKTAIEIFTLLAIFSFAFLLWEAEDVFVSGKKKKGSGLRTAEYFWRKSAGNLFVFQTRQYLEKIPGNYLKTVVLEDYGEFQFSFTEPQAF